MNAEKAWAGCSTTLLSGFPYDGDSSDYKLEKFREELKEPLPVRCNGYNKSWLAIVCSQQMKAKAELEKNGFRELVSTPSGHPNKPRTKNENGGTIYIMWKEIPKSQYQEMG